MSALVLAAGGGIGDVLLATPLIRALKMRFGRVVALVAPAHREVLESDPDVAAVWSDELPFLPQVQRIAAEGFSVAVTTWATLRTAALPYVARVPIRVGQSRRLYSNLFTHRVERRSDRGDRTTHWTQVLLDFGRAIGCDVADATPHFVVHEDARRSVAVLLAARDIAGPYIVLHPTRAIASSHARWPIAPFANLARALAQETSTRVVITGHEFDRANAETIAAAAGAVSLAGATTLPQFGALALGALGVVAMDSGPMHLAAAVGAPTVGIFALQSDEPERWAPLGPRTAIIRPTYPCPPAHRKETCPNFACVAELDTGAVLRALGNLLGRAAERM